MARMSPTGDPAAAAAQSKRTREAIQAQVREDLERTRASQEEDEARSSNQDDDSLLPAAADPPSRQARRNSDAPMKVTEMGRSAPVQELTDKSMIAKVRNTIDEYVFPCEKFFKKRQIVSGPIYMAFVALGWNFPRPELHFKRCKYWDAISDCLKARIDALRQRAIQHVTAKCKGKSHCVYFEMKSKELTNTC